MLSHKLFSHDTDHHVLGWFGGGKLHIQLGDTQSLLDMAQYANEMAAVRPATK